MGLIYIPQADIKMIMLGSRSSRGLGHRPFTAATGVRIPYGMPLQAKKPHQMMRFFVFCGDVGCRLFFGSRCRGGLDTSLNTAKRIERFLKIGNRLVDSI